jgi:hypothetical protein
MPKLGPVFSRNKVRGGAAMNARARNPSSPELSPGEDHHKPTFRY